MRHRTVTPPSSPGMPPSSPGMLSPWFQKFVPREWFVGLPGLQGFVTGLLRPCQISSARVHPSDGQRAGGMSSSVRELLLEVASTIDHRARVAAIAGGLTPPELSQLLDELRSVGSGGGAGAPSAQHVLALCRLLLAIERTREDAIITCIHLLHDQRMRDRAGQGCVAELRAAIAQGPAAAPEGSQPAVAAVAFLQRVCDAIVGFLADPALAAKSAAQVGGHMQALELLPAALECADSAVHVPAGGGVWQQLDEVRTTTVWKVLEARWPAPLLLPLFTALSEVELSHKERHVVYSKVEDGLHGGGGGGGGADDGDGGAQGRLNLGSDVVGLVQAALEAAGRYKDKRAVWLVRELLSSAPATLRTDVLCVVQMALQNGTIQLATLVAAVNPARPPATRAPLPSAFGTVLRECGHPPGPEDGEQMLSPTDVTLLLSAAQNPLVRDSVIDSLIQALLGQFAAAPCESTRVQGMRLLVSQVVQCADVMWLATIILDLSECLFAITGRDERAASMIAQLLLERLFSAQAHARGEILARLFAGLSQQAAEPARLHALLRTLRKLVTKYAHVLRGHGQQLAEGIALLWLLPLREAKSAMQVRASVKRDLFMRECQKRPTSMAKEPCIWQKSPANIIMPATHYITHIIMPHKAVYRACDTLHYTHYHAPQGSLSRL